MPRRAHAADPPAPAENPRPVPLAETALDPEVRALLEADGIRELYPPQAAALGPVLAGESVVLACPTASGKSLVAYLALLRAARAGKAGLYLVPLRALAHEKAEELARFESLGLKVGISVGDFDLSSERLQKLDVLVATSEKADGLLRRGSPWLDRLGVVVADEVHLLRDPDRGPTLEVSLTRLRRAYPELQVVALSATVGNSAELAAWLDARHIASSFRPVPLKLGVYHGGRISFTDTTTRELPPPGEAVPRLVRTVVQEGGQALVFVNSRRSSEQLAHALVPTVESALGREGRAAARSLAEELGAIGEEETEGIRRLSGLLPHGVAFHNASLTDPERRVVEHGFRTRVLKALVATPTLAAGINLPARRVIVRDTHRYDARLGVQAAIPAMEIQQMLGRAGRPRYDRTGEALLIARGEEEEETLTDTYLQASPEPVESQLASESALRTHVLALVASGVAHSDAGLKEFFGRTFFGHTRQLSELDRTVGGVEAFLAEHELLVRGERLSATRFGRLTSELYLDPMSAVALRKAVERAPIGVAEFPLLAAVAATPDLSPLFVRRGEEAEFLGRYTDEAEELLVRPEEEPLDLGLELFLATLKTAAVLEQWLAETPILQITERYGIGAGDLRTRVEDADWLLFGASRLATAFAPRHVRTLDDLALRVRYGVKEELLDLVRLRGIGRARARLLFRAGYTDRESLRQAPVDRIEQVLGSRKLAEAVVGQLTGRSRAPRPSSPSPLPSPPTEPRKAKPRRLDEFPSEPP